MNTSALFQQSVCLSQEVLIRYVKGGSNAAEIRNVELHLADCEICFDTAEGLSLVEKERLNNIQQELAKRIAKRVSQDDSLKVIPLYRRWYSMAAAIAALILISVYVANIYEQDTDLAQTEEAKPATENNITKIETEALSPAVQNADITTNAIAQEKKDKAAAISKVENDAPAEKNPEATYQNESVATDEIKADDAGSVDIAAVEISESRKVAAAATETVTAKDLAKPAVAESGKQTENDNVARQATIVAKASKKIKSAADTTVPSTLSGSTFSGNATAFSYTVYDAGVNSFNAGDYNSAAGSMNVLLQSQPHSINANYYAGASNYELKNYPKAITQLDVVILNKRNVFYEAALWYKGNSLLKMDSKNEAKTTLQKVVKQNGKYKQQAVALLKGL